MRMLIGTSFPRSVIALDSVHTSSLPKLPVTVLDYRVFSLTWSASMQIYWNKRKCLHKKEFNSQRTGLGHQHGRRFIVLGHQYGRHDVM